MWVGPPTLGSRRLLISRSNWLEVSRVARSIQLLHVLPIEVREAPLDLRPVDATVAERRVELRKVQRARPHGEHLGPVARFEASLHGREMLRALEAQLDVLVRTLQQREGDRRLVARLLHLRP